MKGIGLLKMLVKAEELQDNNKMHDEGLSIAKLLLQAAAVTKWVAAKSWHCCENA